MRGGMKRRNMILNIRGLGMLKAVFCSSSLVANLNRNSESTGHFTQLVWKATKQVGCARKDCNGGQQGGSGDAPGWYVACEYYPAGNVIGNFTENVQPEVKSGAVREIRNSLTALWIAVFFACTIIGML